MKKKSYIIYFFNDNLHEKTFFKKAETFKTSLETLLLKNFRVSFYFLDPWRDFHKISFTHAIWSSRTLREENHIHYVVYIVYCINSYQRIPTGSIRALAPQSNNNTVFKKLICGPLKIHSLVERSFWPRAQKVFPNANHRTT